MKKLIRIVPAISLALAATGNAMASGFQLLEQSSSGLGTAYAGTAVLADDATTVFTNPAGMSLLPQGKTSIAVNLNAVQPSAKFSHSTSTAALFQTLGSGNGGDAGNLAAVPSFYVALPVGNRVSFGFGVNAPFGLKTEYDSGWSGRFQGVKSDVKTLNLNPSLSYQASDALSLGFGLNYQKLEGEFTSAANYAAAVFGATGSAALAAAAGEGSARIKGDDTGWGYNFGAIYQASTATRIGFSYRSAIKYHLTGTADFSRTGNAVVNAVLGNAASSARGGAIYADIKLPDTLTLGSMTRLNDKWDMVGDLAWTGWAKIPDLTFRYADTSIVSSTPENWRNTWRVALGGIYRHGDDWKLRFGIAYDQSPVKDDFRTVRLPDNNRTWLAVGGQYRLSKNSALDFGYSHLFVKDGSIDGNGGNAAAYGRLMGNYSNSVDILGIQYSVAF